MKRILWVLIPLLPVLSATAQTKPVKKASPAPAAAAGYSIQLDIKPFKNQWVYLAYYYGGIKGLADSAFLNAESKGVLKGKTPLQQGIYILASPYKSILFEMLVGKDQQFAVSADSTQMDKTLTFTGSEENQQFVAYSQFINPRARDAEQAREQMRLDSTATDKSKYQAVITKSLAEIDGYRQNVIKTQPESLLSVLFKSMQEHKLPANLLHPKNRQDSIAQYRWGKEHYWDGVDFMDGRLVRTPIFEGKLKGYLESWVVPDADSIIYEFNWMIALGRNDPEMFKYLIGYFVDNYMYPKIMGQDKVFLHVYQRYISGEKPKVDWLNEKQMKAITDRAYMVMANQLGTPAWDMELLDTSGKVATLYNTKAEYTVVAFWDVHCGKCREEIPKMDTLYNTKWKAEKVKIYAVMVNEESTKDWPAFIREHAPDWTHVHQPSAMKAEEEKAGKPNFRQLYDMRSTPTLYLLDKDKKIIAKNVGLTDLDNVLQEKIKRGTAAK
jgi:cytochrome oxidase Cu insertion factor (SCO1/SenC/PrrC family)